MKKKLLLIDTFNFLHRAFHALPASFRDQRGEPTNAIYGVTSMLISVFDLIKPDYVVAAMESREPTFRVEDFTQYKAQRKPMDPDLESQVPKVLEILDAFGIKQVQVSGYEADDVIGTMSKKFGEEVDVIIISNDRDFWQLVDKNTIVMSPTRGKETDWIDEKGVEARLGFGPDLLIDYKALRGDPSDNIPGVYGIGEKTATRLVKEYGSIDDIYKSIGKIKPDSLREKLANNAEEASMSKHLATIITDVPMDVELKECKYEKFNKSGVKSVLEKYNFKSLIKRLGFDTSTPKPSEIHDNQLDLL